MKATPSTETDVSGAAPAAVHSRKMASRVARVVVMSAALGGLVASVIAILAVDRLIAEHADQRLRAATITLAGELDEDRHERKPEPLVATVADENGEIAASGIRLAVFEHDALLAGDRWMFAPAPGSCTTKLVAGERQRACATGYHDWTLVAAQRIDESWLHWLYLLSALGAIVLGAGAGALSSFALSHWAVRPLVSVAKGLSAWRPEAPEALELGPPGDYEEVEAIRAALRDMTRRLRLLLDQTQRFAADAAHEIRTPLTTIGAELELLAEECSAAERPALERASARVARLARLVDRLLVLALPSETLRDGFEPVSLADVAETVASELPAEQRARLHLELESEGLVRGDPSLLTSLVENATHNALKFAPEGSITIRVAGGEGTPVVLRVVDSGPGIPPEQRERVFDPFYRAEPGAAAGHGLGLALIAHIARAHGGSGKFADVPRGAELVVNLPAW